MSEFEKQNEEAVSMVVKNRRLPRKTCWFLSEEEKRQLDELKAASAKVIKEAPSRQAIIMHIGQILVPVVIGAAWMLGAAEDLADPLFAGISTTICALWAVVNFKWGVFNA